MRITLRALTDKDIEAHNAGEDELTVRWLNGATSTAETTAAHFTKLRPQRSRTARQARLPRVPR
ncbi:hypothetical protein [Paractinoplanes atraurantiacus]|uniref:hypothetical protein n=1 Tax=Paractinoplanes atraurantiacus TaxID=1036182 RepID=UPI000BE44515|nr:hypothetical protein [Actinoplanes atraurantiacus]